MTKKDILPQLRYGSSIIECERPEDGYRCRVHVVHRELDYSAFASDPAEADGAFDDLPDLGTIRQLRELLSDGSPIGLYIPEKHYERTSSASTNAEEQAALGGVYMIPPQEWQNFRSMWQEWFFDGPEVEFEEYPFEFEDTLGFAMRNFSPDIWFIVIRGEMAGHIYLWGHDGDGDAWADDLTGWAERIHADLDEAFGGVISYGADAIEGHIGEDVYPVRVVDEE